MSPSTAIRRRAGCSAARPARRAPRRRRRCSFRRAAGSPPSASRCSAAAGDRGEAAERRRRLRRVEPERRAGGQRGAARSSPCARPGAASAELDRRGPSICAVARRRRRSRSRRTSAPARCRTCQHRAPAPRAQARPSMALSAGSTAMPSGAQPVAGSRPSRRRSPRGCRDGRYAPPRSSVITATCGARQAGQRRDLAGMVHADLGHAERARPPAGAPASAARPSGCCRTPRRRCVGPNAGEDGAQHLLGRGLADAAGDGDHPAAEPRPAGRARAPAARPACRDHQQRRVRRHASARCTIAPAAPSASASATWSWPSPCSPTSATNRSPGLQRARVDGDAASRRTAPQPPAGRGDAAPRAVQSALTAATASRRTTATSSNGSVTPPIVWPCSCPLPATTSTSPGPSSSSAGGDGGARGRRSRCAPGQAARMAARMAAGSSLRGLSSVTMARSASRARGRAHQRTLAAVAVAAGAEHHVQPARRVRAQRGQQPLQRVRRVGVIDIDGGAVRQRAPPVPSARARRASRGSRSSASAVAGRHRQPGRQQRVVGLEPAGQRQLDRAPCAVRSAPASARRACGTARSRRMQSPSSPTVRRSQPRAAAIARSAAMRRRRPAPCWPPPGAPARQQLGEQPQLGGAVGRHACRDSPDGRASGW